MQNITFHVKGMSCERCVNSIESELMKLGVTAVTVNLSGRKVQVIYDEHSLTADRIRDTIVEQGYEVA
ncbi:copper ion binding protein [Paenibacillus sp. FJAT-26967]|uniref:copper ion binding protein n=1 Tax=Paenibacillus sp. FJAT-26967 TaxID=1729690 RepID=UPI000838284F|nr:copper ion binding protein [Paenibacillus sp. FJAT-26967]